MTEKNENKNNDINFKKKLISREISIQTNTDFKTLSHRESGEYKKKESVKYAKNESCLTRLDSFGNPILKHGKQKISFIDKISKNKFVDVVDIESYKTFNKMEEISSSNMQNNCCLIE